MIDLAGIKIILRTEQQFHVFNEFKSLIEFYDLKMTYIDYYHSYCDENKLVDDLTSEQIVKLRIEISLAM